MKEKGYKFRDHTADIEIFSWGQDLCEAYEQTALSLMETISPDLEKIDPKIKKELEVTAEDKEALLFDFLSEFLYIFDVENLIFSEIKVETIEKINDEYQLKASMKGEQFDRDNHEIGTEVKAITYSFMEIKEEEDKVEISIVFDI
ncbi:MAG: archease [Promethearchaeia archaeon]